MQCSWGWQSACCPEIWRLSGVYLEQDELASLSQGSYYGTNGKVYMTCARRSENRRVGAPMFAGWNAAPTKRNHTEDTTVDELTILLWISSAKTHLRETATCPDLPKMVVCRQAAQVSKHQHPSCPSAALLWPGPSTSY
jgi:hypothetical protein